MSKRKTSPAHKPVSKKHRKQNRSACILSGVLILLMVVRVAAGFARPARTRNQAATAVPAATVVSDEAKAESALTTFFNLLSEHRYAEATTYYGGSYDVLADENPQDAGSHTALLKDACTLNGFQCLPVKAVKDVQPIANGGYVITVTFAHNDGSLLTQPTSENGKFRTDFSFTVAQIDGRYLVEDLPVYLP